MNDTKNGGTAPALKKEFAPAPRCSLTDNRFQFTPEDGYEAIVVQVRAFQADGILSDKVVGQQTFEVAPASDTSKPTIIKNLFKAMTWYDEHPQPKTSYNLTACALIKPGLDQSEAWTAKIEQIIDGKFHGVTEITPSVRIRLPEKSPKSKEEAIAEGKQDLENMSRKLEFIKNELSRLKGESGMTPAGLYKAFGMIKIDLSDIQVRVTAIKNQWPSLCDDWEGLQTEITSLLAVTQTEIDNAMKPASAPAPKKDTEIVNDKLVEQNQRLVIIRDHLNEIRLGQRLATRKLFNAMGEGLNDIEVTLGKIKQGSGCDISKQTEDIANLRKDIATEAARLNAIPTHPPVQDSKLDELKERLANLEQKMLGAASQTELNNLKKEVESVKTQIADMKKSLGEMKETGNTTLLEFRAFANRPQAAAIPTAPPSPQVIYLTVPTTPAPAQNPVADPAVQKLQSDIDRVLAQIKNLPTTPATVPATPPPVIPPQPTKNKKKTSGALKWVIPFLALLAFLSVIVFGLCWMYANGKQNSVPAPTPPPANNVPDEATRRIYMAETDRANAQTAKNAELQRQLSMTEYARQRAESNATQLAAVPPKATMTFGNVGNGAIVANNGSMVNVFPTTIIERPAPAPKREIARPKPMGYNPAPEPAPQVQSETIVEETVTRSGSVQLQYPPSVIIYGQPAPQVWVNPNWAGPMNGGPYGYDYPYGPVVRRGYGY